MVEVRLGPEARPASGNGQADSTWGRSLSDDKVEDFDTRVVVDKRGRKLVVQRPELLAEFHFAEAAGAEAAANTTWMGLAMPLIYLVSIDGHPAPLLRNKLAIDSLIKELGRDGYSALSTAIMEIIAKDAELEEARVKNS